MTLDDIPNPAAFGYHDLSAASLSSQWKSLFSSGLRCAFDVSSGNSGTVLHEQMDFVMRNGNPDQRKSLQLIMPCYVRMIKERNANGGAA